MMLEGLSSVLDASTSIEVAIQSLQQRSFESFLKEVSEKVLNGLEVGNALGRSVLVEQDRIQSGGTMVESSDIPVWMGNEWIVCDDVVRVSFDLVPKEVLEVLRFRALTIAGVEHDGLIARVKEELQRAAESGLTIDEFRRGLGEIFDSFGVTRLSDYRIQTIFRTNMFSAFAIGQLDQAVSMQDKFPFWRYSAILDNRTRASHRALNGRIFRTGEGPLPPIDYNCRCTAVYVHQSQAEGLKPSTWGDQTGIVKFDTITEFTGWALQRFDSLQPATKEWLKRQL